jgi:ABC-type dipeptide/oligopeptide/nickel transport system ATPase component
MPPGCAFAPRCAHRLAACEDGVPPASTLSPGHRAACLRASVAPLLAEPAVA